MQIGGNNQNMSFGERCVKNVDFETNIQQYSDNTITVNVYEVVSHKVSHTLRPLLIYCVSPPEF
jgi:hypothetical protein